MSDFLDRLKSFFQPTIQIVFDDEQAFSRPGHYTPPPVQRSQTADDLFQSLSPTQENNLLVTVFSAFACTLSLTGLIRRPSGVLTPIGPSGAGYVLNVPGDRSVVQSLFALGSIIAINGLSAVALQATSTIPVNGCWIIVQTARLLADGTVVPTATIMSGPVTLLQPLAYPGSVIQKTGDSTGYHRVVNVPAPAAGNEIQVFVPTGARWQVNTLKFQLVTSAVAGSREILLEYQGADGSITEFATEAQGSLQPASTTNQYAYGFTLAPTVSTNFGTGASSSTRQSGLPGNRFLNSGESVLTRTAALDIGDQYQLIALGVIEVLDPAGQLTAGAELVSWSGTTSGSQDFDVNTAPIVFAPGTYNLTVNVTMTIKIFAAGGGGGGGNGGGTGGGSGGGGGGVSQGTQVQLAPGNTYQLIVGVAGAAVGSGGQSKFTNTTGGITVVQVGGGAAGISGGGVSVAGGTATIGGNLVPGGASGGGNVNPGGNGVAAVNGAGGGGGGAFGAGANNGGVGGAGSAAGGLAGLGNGGSGGNNGGLAGGGGASKGADGGGGGGGGGAEFVSASVAFGGGGGGGGATGGAANLGGSGLPGVLILQLISVP